MVIQTDPRNIKKTVQFTYHNEPIATEDHAVDVRASHDSHGHGHDKKNVAKGQPIYLTIESNMGCWIRIQVLTQNMKDERKHCSH